MTATFDDPIRQLVEAQLEADPQLGWVRMLLERPDEEPDDRLRMRRAIAKLRRQYREATETVEALEELLGDIAAALGTCPACLGHEAGGPGWRRPDPALFDRWVRPLLDSHDTAPLSASTRSQERKEDGRIRR